MEVIHSTNIVFSTAGVRRNGDDKTSRYRRPASPAEAKVTKPSKASPKPLMNGNNGAKHSPPEGQTRPQVLPSSVTDDVSVTTNSPLFKPSNRAPDIFGGGPVLETPLSWKKRESPADSGIDLTPISVSPSKINPKVSYQTKYMY